MLKFLVSICALSSQLQAQATQTLPEEPLAVEPRLSFPELQPEAEPLVPADLPGVESVALNDTGIHRSNLTAEKYGVHIERADLSKCEHYKNYLPYFYCGLTVNSRGWMTGWGKERFTSMALLKPDNTIISATSGAWPPKTQHIYHTWEMIHFGTSFQDIRTTNPGTLRIRSWNAGQQIYVPLYMADTARGRAYMLHIYPETAFLRYPSEYSYENGVLWAKGDRNRLYEFEIDVAGLIRALDNFQVANYWKYITARGVVQTSGSGYQWAVVYDDVRHIDVQGLTLGSATDRICRDSVNAMDMTWSQMKATLQREFQWL